MAKGSVRKKGKKWYYRFYVEDASGNLVQKECVGTESKSETEKLLRQARYGERPRMKSYTCLAGLWKSMRQVSLKIFGAGLSSAPCPIISL